MDLHRPDHHALTSCTFEFTSFQSQSTLLQGLAERNQSQSALKVRLLQSCGAHMAMCHGGKCFRTSSWRDIVAVFRQAVDCAVLSGRAPVLSISRLHLVCQSQATYQSVCSSLSMISVCRCCHLSSLCLKACAVPQGRSNCIFASACAQSTARGCRALYTAGKAQRHSSHHMCEHAGKADFRQLPRGKG